MHSSFYVICVLFYFSLNCLCTTLVHAQYEEENFVRLTVKDGLSHNYVKCIQQDDLGYIWVGTDMGINRYDGSKFKSFLNSNQQPRLGSGVTHKIKKMGLHQLGIINRYGFQLLNTKNLSVKNYFIADNTPFFNKINNVWDVVPLLDGSFALSTVTGFYILDKQGKIKLRYDAYTFEDIGKKNVFFGRDIFPLSGKKLAVYIEEDKLASYDAEKEKFTPDAIHEKDLQKLYPPNFFQMTDGSANFN